MKRQTILSADIGGTNTRLSLIKVEYSEVTGPLRAQPCKIAPGELILHECFENHKWPNFIDLLKHFLNKQDDPSCIPLAACFAVAGPVKDNKVCFTNRDVWVIEGSVVQAELGIQKVHLINDFVAAGFGLLTVDDATECEVLQAAPKDRNSPIACIGPGTGLGECFLTPSTSGDYRCFASEGGHAEFAPRNDLEMELLSFLKTKFKQQHRVSVERVVSGPGIASVYEFLCQKFPELVDNDVHAKFLAAGDLQGKVVAKNTHNELCKKALDIFVGAYGSEAGVAALKWLPFGGLYLTGGLTPKNLHLIRPADGGFMHAFHDKGRVSGMLTGVPVFAVKVENLGERGAHYYAYNLLVDTVAASSVAAIAPVPALLAKKGPSLENLPARPREQLSALNQLLFFAGAAAFGFAVASALRGRR